MEKRHIYQCLKDYSLSKSVRLHMPGHKGEGFFNDAFSCDITELSFSDNLACPEGVIKKAQEDIARLLKVKKSYILTGGSSLGVLSMIYAVKNRGKKMIIARSSHKSVYNGLKLCGIEPVFLYEDIKSGLPCPNYVNENIIESCDNDVIGALITTPDYFGASANLKYFAEKLHKQGKLLLVDGAHGAHTAFLNRDIYPGDYADIWVDGAHKTLETLTQGAVLNTNNLDFCENIEDALSIFSTSSPSYLIMASVENGVKSFAELSPSVFDNFLVLRKKIVESIYKKGFSVYETQDVLKLTIDFNGKADGLKVQEYFEKLGIFVELASPRFMLFMLSPKITYDETNRIINAILTCESEEKVYINYFNSHLPKRKISYNEAISRESEYVDLSESEGRVCAFNCGVFPPCYPVITAGEVFDKEVIGALSVENTFGMKGRKVKVLRRDND